MRRIIFSMLAALSGAAAFGQGLLDCIEPDVLRALLLQSQGERPPVITGSVPAEISALKMPREFTWIGSAERITGRVDATTNLSQVTAAYRSSLAPAAARTATAAALQASGWEVREMPGIGMGVFNATATQTSQPACREGKPVNFTANAMDGVTYVLLTLQRGNSNTNTICNQPVRPEMFASSGLNSVMPRLDMPVDPVTGAAARMSGSSASTGGNSASAQTEFTLKDSAGNIARHFAKQMAEQGWTSDANWSGTSTAGSSWSKRDGGALIQGTLSVTALDDQQFMAMMRVIKLQ